MPPSPTPGPALARLPAQSAASATPRRPDVDPATVEALKDTYKDRNVIYHLKAASTAQVLPFSTAMQAKRVAEIIDQTIRASLEQNNQPIESAIKQAADMVRALYAVGR